MGFPPTKKKENFNTIAILRFKNGKAVERWSLTNDMEVAGELGIIKYSGVFDTSKLENYPTKLK